MPLLLRMSLSGASLIFALMARTIDMDLAKIPESALWNADFTLKDDEIYDPDLNNSS